MQLSAIFAALLSALDPTKSFSFQPPISPPPQLRTSVRRKNRRIPRSRVPGEHQPAGSKLAARALDGRIGLTH